MPTSREAGEAFSPASLVDEGLIWGGASSLFARYVCTCDKMV